MTLLQKILLGAAILSRPEWAQAHVARVADESGQIAYLLSYLYWAWCFLGKEQPVPRTAPPELVHALAKELETLKSTGQVSTQV